MFLRRNALLQGEIKELQSGIEELEKICHNEDEYRQAQEIFLPLPHTFLVATTA